MSTQKVPESDMFLRPKMFIK